MAENDKRFNIIDEATPRDTLLTAHYRRSFAYLTVRDRLPVILTQIIDQISRDKDELISLHGEVSRDEIKTVLANLSQLKYELQTDKEFRFFDESCTDFIMWNKELKENYGRTTYYSAVWLVAECYLYRRIKAILEQQPHLKEFDYFCKQKQTALLSQMKAMKCVSNQLDRINAQEIDDQKNTFLNILKINLWGNRCDLSITTGKHLESKKDPFATLTELDSFILANDSEKIWDIVKSNGDGIIDIVNDNAGYEFYTDLVLADFCIQNNLAKCVRFHVKQVPWFISDVMPSDFHWTLEILSTNSDEHLCNLGNRCLDNVKSGRFILMEPNFFWTTGYPFHCMEEKDANLYNALQKAKLIIFKGDLNYRKLLGELNWEPTTPFENALQGFRPSNLCSLRTIKADLICGLQSGVAEQLTDINPKWMETGEYGVIQFAEKEIK